MGFFLYALFCVHYALNTKLMSHPCLCYNKKIQIGLKFELKVVCAIVILEYICDFVTLEFVCDFITLESMCDSITL
jgi:hypothetical protein